MKPFFNFLILFMSAVASAQSVDLKRFAGACKSGAFDVASAWIRSDAAVILASMHFNPNTSSDVGGCHRQSSTHGSEIINDGAACNFVHPWSDLDITTTIHFPVNVRAEITPISGVEILSFVDGFAPVFSSVDSHGKAVNIPGGKFLASCDIGLNSSFLLFDGGVIWELDELAHK